MRVLFFSDLHQDHEAIMHIQSQLDQVDYAFGLGDFASFGKGLQDTLTALDVGTDIYLLPGNHDPAEELKLICASHDSFHYFHSELISFGKTTFAGLGGGLPGLPFGVTEEQVRFILCRFYLIENLILCTHTPPYGTVVDKTWGGNHIGYRGLRDFVLETQPQAVYSGHVHECEGTTGKLGETQLTVVGPKGLVVTIDA
jgi:Icc-related predicted phosphoesterase